MKEEREGGWRREWEGGGEKGRRRGRGKGEGEDDEVLGSLQLVTV